MDILLAAQFQTCLVECQGNESQFGPQRTDFKEEKHSGKGIM